MNRPLSTPRLVRLERFTSLLFLLLVLFTFSQHGAVASAQQALTEYIPPSTVLAISAKPKQMLARPQMQLMPTELVEVFGKKELGMDLMQLEEILLLVDKPADIEMRQPPGFAILARFSQPQTIGGRLLESGQLEEMTLLGKKGFRMEEVQIVVIDDRTFCLAVEKPYFSKLLGARGQNSKIKKGLTQRETTDDVSVQFVLEPVREMIKSTLPPAEQIPVPFRQYLKLADLMDGISYTYGESERLEISAVDAAAAEEMVKLLENGIDFGKHAALSWFAFESGIEDEDYQDAIIKYAERLTALIKKGLADSRQGDRLVIDVQGETIGTMGTIGVLVGMLLPAVQQVRAAARRTTSANNLRQLAIAILNYESAFQRFPTQANYSKADKKPLLSWRVHILPYIEQQQLYEQFRLDEPWDSEHNKSLIPLMPTIYASPDLMLEPGKTVYLGVAGEGHFFTEKKIGFGQISDGTSNTLMIVEANEEAAQFWTKPADWEMKAESTEGVGDIRPAGFNVAFADGSVRLIPGSVRPTALKAACTIAGGETEQID